jgi:hypothetical protein
MPCRCFGAYIHSLEIESPDRDSKEPFIQHTNLIGCVIWSISGIFVHEWHMNEIVTALRTTVRPYEVIVLIPWPEDYFLRPDTEKYTYYTRRLGLREFLSDPRKHVWLQDFIISVPNQSKRSELGIMISAILMCYKAETVCMDTDEAIISLFQSNPYLFSKYEKYLGRRKDQADTSRIQPFIQHEIAFLNYSLEKQLYEYFLNSIAYLRMCGHFYKCFEYEDLSIEDIVKNEQYFSFYNLYASILTTRNPNSKKLVHWCHLYRMIEEYLEDGDDRVSFHPSLSETRT